MHTAVKSDFAASDALAYAAVTDRILRDKRPATQHTGYSKLAATAIPVTDSTHVSNTNAEQRMLKRNKRLELSYMTRPPVLTGFGLRIDSLSILSLLRFKHCRPANTLWMLLQMMMAAMHTVLNSVVLQIHSWMVCILVTCGSMHHSPN